MKKIILIIAAIGILTCNMAWASSLRPAVGEKLIYFRIKRQLTEKYIKARLEAAKSYEYFRTIAAPKTDIFGSVTIEELRSIIKKHSRKL
ncbi:hypothetical protein ACFL2G_03130 [Candidatus Omnitrophota bacterium]